MIPYRGSWLDFEFDAKDIVHVRIDRRRKLPVTTLLMALPGADSEKLVEDRRKAGKPVDPTEIQGMSQEEILNYFYGQIVYKRSGQDWVVKFDPERMKGMKLVGAMKDAKTNKVVADAGDKMTPRLIKRLQDGGLKDRIAPPEELYGAYAAVDIVNEKTGQIHVEAGDEVAPQTLEKLLAAGVKELPVLAIDHINVGPYIRDTLAADKNRNREEALLDIYRVMRPGEPPTVEAGDALLNGLFFDFERYDLSAVGRVKMNMRLGLDVPDTHRVLRKHDVLAIVKVLVELKDGRGEIDDIDNLGNRRVRSVGELMENQFRIGLLRMERAIKERMSTVEIDRSMSRTISSTPSPWRRRCANSSGSSQLSQFMDQTNPLSEITHKRRLSALGPGGLTRERAGFEVRDVHPTGTMAASARSRRRKDRISDLINSLATYARVKKYGFIETPYRKVEKGKVTDHVDYFSAMQEAQYTIAQANAPLDKGRPLRGRDLHSLPQRPATS